MTCANYQPYPAYEESKIEWIGEMPVGWEVHPFFVHASQCKRSNRGMVNDNLLSLSFGRVIRKDIETSEGLLPESFETYQVVELDDVVFRLTDLQNDKRSLRLAICQERGIITSAYLVVQPVGIEPDYLAYLMRSYDLTKVLYALGSGLRQSLKYSDMKRLPLLVPSAEEQTQIVKFLDYETAKIDSLIAKQHQLIGLLKEKRQAVINHAVTKGLDPDATMRDSGVEWLGDVPAHWTVCRVKQVAEMESGHTPSRKVEDYWVNCHIPWVSLNDTSQLKVVDYISETAVCINEKGMQNSSAHELPAGCVVFTRDATIGLAAITARIMAVSQHIIAWVCDPMKVSSEYLLLVFYAMERELEKFTFGATLKTIGMPDVRRLTAAFPPLDQQARIVEHVFDARESISTSIEKSEAMLEILAERRTALISAAVTGKIDVRGWEAPEPPAEVA